MHVALPYLRVRRGTVGRQSRRRIMSDPGLNGFPIRRIPPSHDYIRRDGAGPKDGWARGPADPGPAPAAAGAVTSTEDVPATPDTAPGDHLSPPKDDGIPPPFVHLHVHSNFSFLDGGSRIAELVDRAVELGQPALALTDHDGLYGAVRFAKACIRRGLQPIFGVEVCVESLTGEPPAGSDEGPAGTEAAAQAPRPTVTGDPPAP